MAESNMRKDLVRLRRRIAAGKKAMRKAEIKAENLKAAIQSEIERGHQESGAASDQKPKKA